MILIEMRENQHIEHGEVMPMLLRTLDLATQSDPVSGGSAIVNPGNDWSATRLKANEALGKQSLTDRPKNVGNRSG